MPNRGKWMNGSGKWLAGISAAIFVVWAGWVSVTLNSVDKRVAVIEGNRFDSRDALQHAEADRQLHEKVNNHLEKPGHPVMIERIVAMHDQLDRIEQKQKEMDKKIDQLE